MLKRRITTSGNSAALVLSRDILGLMGLSVGDEVELEVRNRTLLVRPIDGAERPTFRKAADEVFSRRKTLLKRLAEGAGSSPPKRKR